MSKSIKKTLVIIFVILFAALAYYGLNKSIAVSAETPQDENSSSDLQTYSVDSNDLGYTLVNGTEYKVRAINKNLTYANIPKEYNGLPVTEVASNAFMSCKYLTRVDIPATIKRISSNAFYGCKELARVYGASNIESIASNAFYNCVKLKYFCIPDTITTLGNTIFKNNPNNVYVRMEENEFSAISGISSTWLNGRTEDSEIIYGTDMICEPINEKTPAEGYKLIQAQESNMQLSRSVDNNIFVCSKIEVDENNEPITDENGEQIKVPIKSIDANAFENWEGEELIVVYDKEEGDNFINYPVNICSVAFGSLTCSAIRIEVNITINDEDNVGELSSAIFTDSAIEELTLPDTIHAIPDYTFYNCKNLKTIKHGDMEINHLSNSINYIGSYAFGECTNLKEIHIPGSVEKMGEKVFDNWNKQTIFFDSLLPVDSTKGLELWNSELSTDVTVRYNTKVITLDNQGGIGGTQEVEAEYNKNLPAAEAPKPIIENLLEFDGYYAQLNGQEVKYYNKDMSSAKVWGRDEIEAGLDRLYAKWKKKVIPINLIFGDDDSCNATIYVQYEEKFGEISFETNHKDGYEFDGFYSEENGGGTKFYDKNLNPTDNLYTDLSIEVLYANWIPIRYQVSLLPNGGSGGTEIIYMDYESKFIYLNEDDVEPVSQILAPINPNRIFLGYFHENEKYFSAFESDGIMYAKCCKEWNFATNFSLKAEWEDRKYTITLNADGGNGGTEKIRMAYSSKTVYSATENKTISVKAPQKEYYEFLGYFDEDESNCEPYFSGGESYYTQCIRPWDFLEDRTLIAHWKPIEYTITYEDFPSELKPKNKTTITIEDVQEKGFYSAPNEVLKYHGLLYTWSEFYMFQPCDYSIQPTVRELTIQECYDDAADTYYIWRLSQFNGIRDLAESTYRGLAITKNIDLMADIDLSNGLDDSNWEPFPKLMGSFYGGFHTITGLRILITESHTAWYGLFSENYGIIQHLNVEGDIYVPKISGNGEIYAGLICGYNVSGSIIGCTSSSKSEYGIVSYSRNSFIGGIAGLNLGVICDCTNYSGLSGYGHIGGITARNGGYKDQDNLLSVKNEGKILFIGSNNGEFAIGGIVGVMLAGRIQGAVNSGDIVITQDGEKNYITHPCVGKIVGICFVNNSYLLNNESSCTVIIKDGPNVNPYYVFNGDIGRED